MSAVLIGVGFIVVMLTVVGIVMYNAWRRQVINWLPLPGFLGCFYISPASVSGEQVAQAWRMALEALDQHTRWKMPLLVATRVRIFVVAGNKWTDLYGRTVGGLQLADWLYVGLDLSALAHELAHYLESLEGTVDDGHQTWAKAGIWDADEAYRAAMLKAVPPPQPP